MSDLAAKTISLLQTAVNRNSTAPISEVLVAIITAREAVRQLDAALQTSTDEAEMLRAMLKGEEMKVQQLEKTMELRERHCIFFHHPECHKHAPQEGDPLNEVEHRQPSGSPGAILAEESPIPPADPVNHPKHYTSHPSGVECITITEHMGFNLGNALKYIWRADLKNDAIEDLRKAAWYVEREIQKRGVTK